MATVFVMGGKGDMSGSRQINGGAYDPSQRTWDDMQTSTGDAVAGTGTCTIDDDGGSVRVNAAGVFAANMVGIYAYLTSSVYTTGRYLITAAATDSITLDLTYTGPETDPIVLVGGALGHDAGPTYIGMPQLEEATDAMGPGDICKIRNTLPPVYAVQDWDIDGASGTGTAPCIVEAVDADGVRDTSTRVLVHLSSNTSNEPLLHFSGATSYWNFYGFDFSGNSLAYQVLDLNSTNHYHSFYDCKFYNPNASQHVANVTGDSAYLCNCEIYGGTGTGGYGLVSSSPGLVLDSCYIHDNAKVGITLSNGTENTRLFNCRIVDNSSHGLTTANDSVGLVVANCTFADNAGHGLSLSSGASDPVISHCMFTGNLSNGIYTTGLGVRGAVFEYCNAYGNTGADLDVGTWATERQGNHITLDPSYDSNYFSLNMSLNKGGHNGRRIGAGVYKDNSWQMGGVNASLVGSPITGGF